MMQKPRNFGQRGDEIRRFGKDPADSVLDPDCRAWEFDNLYVADGAFMPTSGGANPTLTIEANSFRVAERLVERC